MFCAPRLADAGCPLACTPTAASACPSTQRCTWRVDGQLTEKGAIGCAPSGAIAQNLPCTRDSNGGDNCVSGTTCYMDKCRTICALGGASTCDVGMTCTTTAFFVPCGGTMAVAGLCL